MIDLERTKEEIARENYVLDLKLHVNTVLGPQLKSVYKNSALPNFKKEFQRLPLDRHEIRKAMLKENLFQLWGSFSIASQEMMWDAIGDEIFRQTNDLNKRAKIKNPNGTLSINKNFKIPDYVTSVHIHHQPGGYELELDENDITAGVFCEGAHRIYSKGQGNKSGGFKVMNLLIDDIKKNYPHLKPKRILDIGCNIGRTTITIKENFPDSEVFGIDVSPGVVRYAHCRAESLGYTLNFDLQNGEKTDYNSNYFDLIVSGTLLHETSFKAIYNIFNECHRILKPGGVMAHLELALRTKDMKSDLYNQWYRDWSTHFNAEPFWGKLHDMDVMKAIHSGGFPSSKSWEKYLDLPEGGKWWACGSEKQQF